MEVVEAASAVTPQPTNLGSNSFPDVSVPLSFPAILRNPGIKDRYAYLYDSKPRNISTSTRTYKKNKRDDNEGRRWIKRKENGRFLDS